MSFDDEYRARALDGYQLALDALCEGSGRKGQHCGREHWATCPWCLNDIRTDGSRGFWMAAHVPDFAHDDADNVIEGVFDVQREGREVQRERGH